MPESRYVLKPRPPIRAFLMAAGVSIVGAMLLVLSLANEWSAVVGVLSGFLLALGVVVAVLALVMMRALAVTVTLTSEGYAIEGSSGPQRGRWSEVGRVSRSSDGSIVNIYDHEGTRRRLAFANPADPQIDDLLADVAQRLDDSRGYTGYGTGL